MVVNIIHNIGSSIVPMAVVNGHPPCCSHHSSPGSYQYYISYVMYYVDRHVHQPPLLLFLNSVLNKIWILFIFFSFCVCYSAMIPFTGWAIKVLLRGNFSYCILWLALMPNRQPAMVTMQKDNCLTQNPKDSGDRCSSVN